MGWPELYERGRHQHGAVSPRCAAAAEVPPRSLVRRATRERWPMLGPDIWLLPGAPDVPKARLHGALLAAPGGVVAGWSAAHVHGLRDASPTRIEVLRDVSVSDLSSKRLAARRSRCLPAEDVTEVDGLRVTTIARTLRDLSRRVRYEALRGLAIDARVHHRDLVAGLNAIVRRDRRFPGRPALRHLIDELADDGSDSGFEHRTVQRLTAAGLAPDQQQIEVSTHLGTRHLDLGYLAPHVAIECVGFAYHSSADDLARDVHRSNAIAVEGQWLVLRLTWEMFHREWDTFLGLLRRCLAERT